jgi:hypothetical protein
MLPNIFEHFGEFPAKCFQGWFGKTWFLLKNLGTLEMSWCLKVFGDLGNVVLPNNFGARYKGLKKIIIYA